jgi:cobalt-zinc-cadmium efflux system membrane fusion protein
VLGGAAALGWWGHRHEWKVPKFSELMNATAEETVAWCKEHPVPEAECVVCKPELMPRPKAFGWCKIHGVHECVTCHPELAQVAAPSQVSPADRDRIKAALEFTERPTNNPICKLHERRIQFASEAAVEKSNVEVEPVGTGAMVETLTASAELTVDPTRTATIACRVPGRVWKVMKHTGDRVQAGELLAIIDAPEVGKAKAEYLQAAVQLKAKSQALARLLELGGDGSTARIRDAEVAVQTAEFALRQARQSLTNLGLTWEEPTDAKADSLEQRLHFAGLPTALCSSWNTKSTTTNLIPLYAINDGIIVSHEVTLGEQCDPSKPLFETVDDRSLWLMMHVRSEEAGRIRLGQTVQFQPDGQSTATARVTWIGPQVDPRTRTVPVRAVFAAPVTGLRSMSFGVARVVLREEPRAIVVPSEAVQNDGCCTVVFVRDKNYLADHAPKVFHTRTVRVGGQMDGKTEILAGLLPGELIVVKGTGVLRAELLRGNIGDGCGCGK